MNASNQLIRCVHYLRSYGENGKENDTAVTITVGETVIPATLNISKAAQDLISKNPFVLKIINNFD
jgi:hypothetical protein